jgi:bifunctional non-homologous end joining protein LigD
MLWDRGTWEPQPGVDVDQALADGKLAFVLHGARLKGKWALVRLRRRSTKDKDNWLLIKELDDFVERRGKPVTERETTSVASDRSMAEIAEGRRVWHSGKAARSMRNAPEILAGPVRSKDATSSDSKKTPERPRKTKNTTLPAFVAPQLATLVEAPPVGDGWLHEIKYDGYRAVTSLADGKVVIRTRNGLDWTDRFAALVPALSALDCGSAELDGEIAVADARGHTDFGALQDALGNGGGRIAYYLFDLLALDGENLRKEPLVVRKHRLKALIGSGRGPLLYSDHVTGNGEAMFARACGLGLEGIVSKRADAPYRSGRSRAWLKVKCGLEQEFVIVGWRPSTKAGRPFSSLLVAVRDGGVLRYAGRVGSGYSGAGLAGLSRRLKALARKTSPVDDVPNAIAQRAHFVEPKLVAEIAFRGWTRDGLVRQGSFKGLRGDTPAGDVVRDREMPVRKMVRGAAPRAGQAVKRSVTATDGTEIVEGVRVTHPDRVLFADQQVTMRELIQHYIAVADRILPHIVDRPISLVRCPQGSGKACFFQKHASDGFPEQFQKVRITEKSGTEDYLFISDLKGLVAAVQVGVLELHLWGCHVDAIEQPDRLVFDFDPDEGLEFAVVRDAARQMRGRLEKLGLQSFAMVTGGKGVHVVAPLTRGHSWEQHRDFAEAMARLMEEEEPERFVATMSKTKRKGRIFVDYLRNQRGATAIAPFSTRARKGAYVALPVSWPTLARLQNAHPVAVGEAVKAARSRDPWPDYFRLKQKLPRL